MNTIRTISNISYNSPAFLEALFADLVKRKVIEWAHWIYHNPDEDDKKGHFHFVLKPAARIDTIKLREMFTELDSDNPLPLSCTAVWRPVSSLDDWLLYSVHDKDYLSSKGLSRNCHYDFSDIRSTSPDGLCSQWYSIDLGKYKRLKAVKEAAVSGVPFWVLVQTGQVPISQRAQYEMQYAAISDASHYIDKDGVVHDRPL